MLSFGRSAPAYSSFRRSAPVYPIDGALMVSKLIAKPCLKRKLWRRASQKTKVQN